MESTQAERSLAAVAGGWVADAASLGVHWLYDGDKLRHYRDSPEFLPPSRVPFADGGGFFAHAARTAGDVSHYGAAVDVFTESLAANDGHFRARDFQRRFRDRFGPGGEWVGYIDHPTRETLNNLTRMEVEAREQALNARDDLTREQARVLAQKVMPHVRRYSGTALDAPVREAVSLTYTDTGLQDAGVALARSIDDALCDDSGAADTQLPAVTRLVPLLIVNAYHGKAPDDDVEAAVRVTNNHDLAVSWALWIAKWLPGVLQGEKPAQAVARVVPDAPERGAIEAALAGDSLDAEWAADRFGRTCYLDEAIPLLIHILSHAPDFITAVRANILAGGDSCGRAWIIGPAMAAYTGINSAGGVPLHWIGRCNGIARITGYAEALVGR